MKTACVHLLGETQTFIVSFFCFMSGEAEPSEDDIITQLQGQVVLLTSQFYNYAGYIQKEAPPQGEPLSVEGNGPTPPVGDFLEIFSQCVSETISTTQNICKVGTSPSITCELHSHVS